MKDYRLLQRQAAELRAKAGELAAKQHLSPEDIGRLEGLRANAARLLVESEEARAANIEEAREIGRSGKTVGEGTGSNTEARAFLEYMKTGAEDRAALVQGTGTQGGYIVAESLHAPLIEASRKMDPIFALATTMPINLGNPTIFLPMKATHGAVATATETGARPETAEPTFTSGSLTAKDYYTSQYASRQMIDSFPDFEQLMLGWVVGDIYEQAGVDFAIGGGDGGSTGSQGLFVTGNGLTQVKSGSASTLVNTSFVTTYLTLLPQFRMNAAWIMNSLTLALASTMSMPGLVNVPLVDWGTSDGTPRIFGRPVLEATSAPAIAGGAFPVFLGDVRQAYAIAMHKAPMVLVDPWTVTPLCRYYGLSRLGGMVWNKEAGVLIKVST